MSLRRHLRHFWRRLQAGWRLTWRGWVTHEGGSAADWAIEGLPFPEDDDYSEWEDAYYHYERLDYHPRENFDD